MPYPKYEVKEHRLLGGPVLNPPHLAGSQIVCLCPRHSAKSRHVLGFVASHALQAGGPCLLPWGCLSFEKETTHSVCAQGNISFISPPVWPPLYPSCCLAPRLLQKPQDSGRAKMSAAAGDLTLPLAPRLWPVSSATIPAVLDLLQS